MATAESVIGTANQYVYAQFAPSRPLLPNTEYTAVLIGNDADDLFYGSERRFEGLTSYTSPSGFICTGDTSGFIQVVHPYSKTLQTSEYNSTTGQNDTYTITITSGHSVGGTRFEYTWSQASTPGTYPAIVSGTTDRHSYGNGLQVDFDGIFATGEVHELNVYIPQPLATSYIWKFVTGEITQFTTPPSEPAAISVVVDNTAEGGFTVSTETQISGTRFYVVDSSPAHLEYDISAGLSYIQLEFNKTLGSGIYGVGNVEVTSTPLLGIPTPTAASGITPTRLVTSGKYLKIYLP